MSQSARAELLQRLRDDSAVLVRNFRAGNLTPTDLARAVEERQILVEQLARIDGPVTDEEKATAREIAGLDRTLARWCETKQREIARHLVRRPTRNRPDETRPRIISQTA